MDLENQYFDCVYLIFILKPIQLCFQIQKLKKKMILNQSIINGKQHEEAKKKRPKFGEKE